MRPNPQVPVDLVTFDEEILHGKLLLCSKIMWRISSTLLKKFLLIWKQVIQDFQGKIISSREFDYTIKFKTGHETPDKTFSLFL